MKSRKSSDASGLRLPKYVLQVLRQRGIFAQPSVRVEHQHLARRYVVRGLESGGSVGDVGHYVTFAREDGQPLEYLHPVESIGVNGLHSVVLAPCLVRIEMLRKARTYELLITQHRPQSVLDGKKPALESKTLFRGIHGRLELDLVGTDKNRAGSVLPTFYTMAGEPLGIPKRFRGAVRAVTQAVNCTGCSHCHYLRSAKTQTVEQNTPKSVAVTVIPVTDAA
jgi:hypothetical protein